MGSSELYIPQVLRHEFFRQNYFLTKHPNIS